jgi:hypothetical protein
MYSRDESDKEWQKIWTKLAEKAFPNCEKETAIKFLRLASMREDYSCLI